ncbi:MAG: Cys-tRNA(Pro) deacylase [Propionibacteriaceae bacterium]|jgi:Cys-tRNA(Pro)/Cys-tRNA(Cys) deacylase|nr:Cys-tRNA(Pro) deacylase [Propionibacteriaceae bacterium]
MAKPDSPAGTAALAALARAGVAYTVHEYAHTPGETHFGREGVSQLGLDPKRVFKTLLAKAAGAGGASRLAVGVVPVAGQLDLKALAAAVGAKKAAMAEPAEAERATGYVVGGISPFGQKAKLPTVVDASVLGFPTVYVSAGRRGLQVEVAPADLVRLTGAKTAPITRWGAGA